MKYKIQNNLPQILKNKKFDIDKILSDDNIVFIAKITFGAMLIISLSSILTQNKIYKETYLNMNKAEELRTAYYIQESDILKDGTINDMDFFNNLSLHEQKRILYLKRQGYSFITDKITSINETKEMFNKLQNTKLSTEQKQQIKKELEILNQTSNIINKR